MSNSPIPIALVDDHTLVRKGLVELINSIGGYQVVLEAGNGQELTEALGARSDVALAIVDLNMPIMDGYATIGWLTNNRPEVRALALTFEANETNVIRAMRAGARGFVLKDIEPRDFKTALDQIHQTGYHHTELVQESLMAGLDQKKQDERSRASVLEALTPREVEFLQLVCADHEPTYDQISDVMGVGRRTVDGYREALFEKFGIKSKTGLVLFAIKWGVVKL